MVSGTCGLLLLANYQYPVQLTDCAFCRLWGQEMLTCVKTIPVIQLIEVGLSDDTEKPRPLVEFLTLHERWGHVVPHRAMGHS